MEKETGRLETLSELFDIPLGTLRKWASERRFPGIIKVGRAVRVDIEMFRKWLYSHKLDGKGGGKR